MKTIAKLALAASLLLTAGTASATLLYYEDFNYALADNATIAGTDGWTNGSTSPLFEATGLNGPAGFSGVNVGGALRFGNSQSALQTNWGAAGVPVDGTYWYSFTLQLEGANSRGTFIVFGQTGTNGQNGFGVRFDKASNQIAAWSPHQGASANAAAFVDNATYTIVGRLVADSTGTTPRGTGPIAGNYTNTIWVNPTDYSSVGALGAGFGVTSGTSELGALTSLLSGRSFSGNTGIIVDEVRVGTGLADVVTAIPEPSTYAALLGLGTLAFAAFRRRSAKL